MSQIHNLYLLLTRDFPAGTRDSSMRKILQMRANGRTYESQLSSTVNIVTKVVGNFPVSEPTHVWAILSLHEFMPRGLTRGQLENIFDSTTFGWFEFDNGLKGAIAADFSIPIASVPAVPEVRSELRSPAPTSEPARALSPTGPEQRQDFEAPTLAECRRAFEPIRSKFSPSEERTLSEMILAFGAPARIRYVWRRDA